MLVQALTEYADAYLGSRLGDPAFEEKPVPFAIEIDERGGFRGIVERTTEVVTEAKGKGKGKMGGGASRTVRKPKPLLVAKSPVGRTSGLHPLLACDDVKYVLGPEPGAWTDPEKTGEVENHAERHGAFKELIGTAADATGDAALRACAAFYANEPEVARARADLAARKCGHGTLVALSVTSSDPDDNDPGGPVISRKSVKEFWRDHFRARSAKRVAEGGQGMCLVCGTVAAFAPTHDKIKGAARLGGQPAGVALMSFDKDAFQSYGWKKNANSTVCTDCASKYVLALNDLLRTGEHRVGESKDRLLRTRSDFAGTAYVYWTRRPVDDDPVADLREPDPMRVAALLAAPRSGKRGATVDTNQFHFLAVAGNGGRLVVRYAMHASLDDVKDNIARWFVGIRVPDIFTGAPAEPAPLWKLLASLSSGRGDLQKQLNDDPVLAERSLQLMRRALQGDPLGRTILAAALARLRKETGDDRLAPGRIGLVRMCVNDLTRNLNDGAPTMTENLEPTTDHPAYVCGRLLAEYEALQYAAQGEVNVTIADRYYSLASTFPRLALPKIRDLGLAHLKKLRRDNPGAAKAIGQRIEDLHEMLNSQGKCDPGQLSLEDQGRFAIGFYHQKADARRRIDEAKEAKARKAGVAPDPAAS